MTLVDHHSLRPLAEPAPATLLDDHGPAGQRQRGLRSLRAPWRWGCGAGLRTGSSCLGGTGGQTLGAELGLDYRAGHTWIQSP